jgi:PAS domain S-box-containing protein
VSLKLFRSLLDQSSDAIEVIDPHTLRFLDCNKSAHQTLGYSREEFLSLNVRDIDPTLDPARLSQVNAEIGKSGFATFESLRRRKDGSIFPVEVNVQAVRLERDYRLAVVRDITERKRAEEALRLSEERFAKAFHTNPEPISITRRSDSIILEINDRWESVFGYTREEVIGRTGAELNLYVNPEERLKLKDLLMEQGFLREQEIDCLSKSGDVRHISMSAEQIVINDEPCTIFLIRDITERKRAVEALRRAEEKYHSIFENAVEGIFQTSPDGQFITANSALARMLGYDSPAELLGSRTDIARQHYVEPARRSEFKRLLERHGVVREFEHQAYRKDGSKIWLSENVRAVRDEGGAVLYYEGFTEDITGRRQAEQRLREYEKAVEGLDEMIVVVDRNYRYVLANRALLAHRGLEREQLVGRLVSEVLNPEVFENVVKEKLDQCFAGHVVKYEMTYDYPRLGARTLSISYFPIEGPTGVDRVACVVKDITEPKRAEEALKESQRRLEEAQHIAHVGHWERDLETGTITWSDEIYRILGLVPQEHDSPLTEWQNIVHPEDRERVALVIEEAQRGLRRYDVEYRIARPDGEVRFLHSQGDIVCDEQGRPRRAFGIAQDITEHKRAEEKLKQSERQLAEAQRLAHVGGWDWDLRSNVVIWSDELYRIFGLQPGEIKVAGDATPFIHPEDWDLVFSTVQSSVKNKEPYNFHYRVLRPDGDERIVYTHGRIVCDEDGEPIRVFGATQDVTELKRAEEKLRATTGQLRALSARVHSAKEEEGTRIAREIHDELGTALTSLRWDLESVEKVVSEAGDEPRVRALRERLDAMLRLTEATIGSVRRISAELRPGVLDDLGLAAAVEWQAQQFEARTGISCRCDSSVDDLGLSREQSTAVFRILQEALTNVLQHARATSVDITMRAETGELVLTIIDNGRGITENERTGAQSLGLLGMRERAHLIGGTIHVTGVGGKGTMITVRIPIPE